MSALRISRARRWSAVAVVVVLAAPAVASGAGPVPIDIGPGIATAINDNGQVLSGSIWKQGAGVTQLGVPDFWFPTGINNRAMVVGYYPAPGAAASKQAFLWTPASRGVPLATLPGVSYRSTGAAAINERSQIAGWRSDGATSGLEVRPVMWTPEGWIVDLDPSGWVGDATAINDNGQVVGSRGPDSIRGAFHAFSWTQEGGIVDLGVLPGADYSHATAINNLGQVVGASGQRTAAPHAFLWTKEGGMVDLGTLPGAADSVANGINDKGQVVGSSGGRAFVWSQAGGMVELAPLAVNAKSEALAINEHGQVAGRSYDGELSNTHAVLWFGDTTPPTAQARLVHGQTIASALRRGLKVQLTLSEPANNDIEFQLTSSKLRLAHRTVDTAAGATTITLKFDRTPRTRKAFARLHKVSKATVALRIATRDQAGNSRISTTRLTLKR
jgi:probable HAF family extracellular repeat protein